MLASHDRGSCLDLVPECDKALYLDGDLNLLLSLNKRARGLREPDTLVSTISDLVGASRNGYGYFGAGTIALLVGILYRPSIYATYALLSQRMT
jgi:hypothetical protein